MKKNGLYIIGDVHGCYDTLLALVDKLPKKKAKLVFVGDIIDKGIHSAQVIEYIKTNNHYCILGNHELNMIKALRYINSDYTHKWKANEGEQTMKSYKNTSYNIYEHIMWLETLPYYLEFDIADKYGYKLLVTHGVGLPFYDRLDISKEKITTNKNMKKNNYKIINVFGHSPYKEVKFYQNYIGIDTGCVYSKKNKKKFLSALEWNSKKVYQQAYIG